MKPKKRYDKEFTAPARRGPRKSYRKVRRTQDFDAPTKQGMKAPYGSWRRSGDDERREPAMNFSLIRRFLHKHIGQSWDVVYSKLVNMAKTEAMQALEFMKYIPVELNTYEKDGQIYDNKHNVVRSFGRWPTFYVDSQNLLRKIPRTIYSFHRSEYYNNLIIDFLTRNNQPPVFKWIDQVLYVKWHGAWQEVLFEYRAWGECEIFKRAFKNQYYSGMRTLSAKEAKKLGLDNG